MILKYTKKIRKYIHIKIYNDFKRCCWTFNYYPINKPTKIAGLYLHWVDGDVLVDETLEAISLVQDFIKDRNNL